VTQGELQRQLLASVSPVERRLFGSVLRTQVATTRFQSSLKLGYGASASARFAVGMLSLVPALVMTLVMMVGGLLARGGTLAIALPGSLALVCLCFATFRVATGIRELRRYRRGTSSF